MVGAKHAEVLDSFSRNRERSLVGTPFFRTRLCEMSLSSRLPVRHSLAVSRRPAHRAPVRCVADAATAVSPETLKRKILRLSALTDRGQLLFQQKACVHNLSVRLFLSSFARHQEDRGP